MKQFTVILISENEYSRKTIPVLLKYRGMKCTVFSSAQNAVSFLNTADEPVFVIIDALYPAVEISCITQHVKTELHIIMNYTEKLVFSSETQKNIASYVFADEIPGIIADKQKNWRAA